MLIKLFTYYSQNYAGIIGASLLIKGANRTPSWLRPEVVVTLKFGLILASSDRTTCTNMFSSNSDGWRLPVQACFSLKIQHIPQSGTVGACLV